MLPFDVAKVLASYLPRPVTASTPVGGGCIANACRIEVEQERYFLKWSSEAAAHTFPAEAVGLQALRQAGSPLRIPQVVGVRDLSPDGPGLLLMEWIQQGARPPHFWTYFGRGLAALHRHTNEQYGFRSDNYIGRLPQGNAWADTWPDFFRTQRLMPQVERARQNGRWSERWDQPLENLSGRLDELLPAKPEASLLHGDLWSGNFMTDEKGLSVLVDPAVYYGHREADLSMTELFGGFDAQFYASYREAWPLEAGYEARRDLYNLYHLINHLNHFGGGYADAVEQTLRPFR